MEKSIVIVKQLKEIHQNKDLRYYENLSEEARNQIKSAVTGIFESFGGKKLLKPSGDVYIKPNGIDAKAYCYTRAELVEAVIEYFNEIGANRIFLFENSTQSNFTRLVFEVNGYKKICKKTGAIPLYLDEMPTIKLEFKGKPSVKEQANGYDLKYFHFPKKIYQELVERKEHNLYVNLPKLKTHSMGVITLGIKNQWAFPMHKDRGIDHNYNLHSKFADVLSYIKPDFTLIEGIEGTVYGHYPATALANKCVIPFEILIGGTNVVATDIVGARIFNIKADEVPHITTAIQRNLSDGVHGIDDIEIRGDLSKFTQKYSHELYPEFHPDVNIVKGKELLCVEGCLNNPLTLLQILNFDYNGKGGWDLVIGKGHDIDVIDNLKGPVLIAGHCAIEEVSDRLIQRLGRKKVYLSGDCNDLAATASAMFHLTKVSPLKMVKINTIKAVWILFLVKLHRTHAKVPSLFSNIIKKV